MSHDPAEAVIARFADPRLGLRASREELRAWVAEGERLDPPLCPEAAIRRMLPVKHGGLVREVAIGFLRRGLDLDDLIGEGNLGLIHAAGRYDPGRTHGEPPVPVRFSTYATWAVRQAVFRATLRQGNTIYVPENVFKDLCRPPGAPLPTRRRAARVRDARRALRGSFVAASTQWGPDTYCLDQLVGPPSARTTGREECDLLLPALTERERRIVLTRSGFFGGEPTYRDIAPAEGITWQRVQQVEKRAIEKLRARARRGNITYESVFGEAS